MAFHNVPPNGFPDIPDIEDLEAVQGDVSVLKSDVSELKSGLTNLDVALSVPDGAGKNVLPFSLDKIKAVNTAGTWNGNIYTLNGVTFTIQTDSNGDLSNIKAEGTPSSRSQLRLNYGYVSNTFKGMILNGSNKDYSGNNGIYVGYSNDGINWANEAFQKKSDLTIQNYNYVYFEILCDSGTFDDDFKPMIRPATITDPTFAPYIPSVESRIEAVESGLTNKTGSFSLENGVTAIRNLLVKSVNTVELCGMYQLTLTLSIWNKIGTLPSGYIPMAESRFIVRNSTLDKWMLGKIDTEGGVYVYPTSDDSQAAQTNVVIQQVFITN